MSPKPFLAVVKSLTTQQAHDEESGYRRVECHYRATRSVIMPAPMIFQADEETMVFVGPPGGGRHTVQPGVTGSAERRRERTLAATRKIVPSSSHGQLRLEISGLRLINRGSEAHPLDRSEQLRGLGWYSLGSVMAVGRAAQDGTTRYFLSLTVMDTGHYGPDTVQLKTPHPGGGTSGRGQGGDTRKSRNNPMDRSIALHLL